jgi:hypothetical protein
MARTSATCPHLAQAPEWFSTALVGAAQAAEEDRLEREGRGPVGDQFCRRAHGRDGRGAVGFIGHDVVNVNGGVSAEQSDYSAARIPFTLMHRPEGARSSAACYTPCIYGGEAISDGDRKYFKTL